MLRQGDRRTRLGKSQANAVWNDCPGWFYDGQAFAGVQDDGKWEIAGVQTQFEQIGGNLRLMEQIGKKRPERLPEVPGRNIDLIGKFFVALEQGDTLIKEFWTEDGDWQFPFSSRSRSSLPAAYSWTFRNTHDPDITLVAYERVVHDAQVSVSAAIFYCKDGLIRKVEDYSLL